MAPLLLGAVLTRTTDDGAVSVRLTEVEAYAGSQDPGSHAFRGERPRNRTMFGPAGHLYAYFSYGMHTCANLVCSPAGTATAVLLRAGEVVGGLELARRRRGAAVRDRDLARGPARLTVALGVRLDDDGADVLGGDGWRLEPGAATGPIRTGPRVGVSGEGGTAAFPWRFWLDGDPTVSPYRAAVRRRRPTA